MREKTRLVVCILICLSSALLVVPFTPVSSYSSPTSNFLSDVWCSGYGYWAVGSSGTILSYNSANNWEVWPSSQKPAGLSASLSSVFMLAQNDGWIVGSTSGLGTLSTILRYNVPNFGSPSWVSVTSPTSYPLNDVWAVNGNDSWAVGQNTIIHWNGVSWSTVSMPTSTTLWAIHMLSATAGWAVGGSGTILRWNGASWSIVPTPTTALLLDVYMLSATDGWATGAGGTILHWNGGSWQSVMSPTTESLYGVTMTSATSGYAVGGEALNGDGTLLRWDGTRWRQATIATSNTLTSVDMVNDNIGGWAVGHAGTIVRIPTEITLQYELTVSSTGSGVAGGASGWYDAGSTAIANATASPGWTLDHWELDGLNVGDANPYSVTMNADHTLTAVFVQIPQHSLTITVSGSGSTSPGPGTTTHDEGSMVSVDAQPSSGWTLDHWELDGIDVGAADPYSVTMDGTHTLTAVFVEIPVTQYTLTITTATGSGTTSPLPGSTPYDEGTDVTVNATPETGWTLDHWELDNVDVGDANPYTVTMDDDHTLTAVFTSSEEEGYVLTTGVEGMGTLDFPPGNYNFSIGEEVVVTATPETGWTLDHWVLDGEETDAGLTLTVEMTTSHEVVAVFTETGGTTETPTAAAGPDQTVIVNTTVVFDATNSSDDEGIVTYEWDFGDDATGTGAVTTHTYTTPGTYVVTLTVEDAQANQDDDVLIVTVEEAETGFQLEWWMFIAALGLVIGLAATIYLARR